MATAKELYKDITPYANTMESLLTAVAKAVLAKDGPEGLDRWYQAMAAQWGGKEAK